MAKLVGVQEGLALYAVGDLGVVVDTDANSAFQSLPIQDLLSNGAWRKPSYDFAADPAWATLADTHADITVLVSEKTESSTDRLVRVPRRVSECASRGLDAQVNVVVAPRALEIGKILAGGSATLGSDELAAVRAWHGSSWPTGTPHTSEDGALTSTGVTHMLYGGDAAAEWLDKFAAAPDPDVASADDDATVTPSASDASASGFAFDPQATYVAVLSPHNEALDNIADPYDDGSGDDADVVNPPAPTPAEGDGATPDVEDIDYTGVEDAENDDSDDGLTLGAVALLMQGPDGTWKSWENGQWVDASAPDPDADTIELDEDAATALADAISSAPASDDDASSDADDSPSFSVRVSLAQLFKNAEPEINWTNVERAFELAPYVDPAVRSANAQRQARSPGGKFAPTGVASVDKDTTSPPDSPAAAPADAAADQDTTVVARLSAAGTLVDDVHATLRSYTEQIKDMQDAAQNGGDVQAVADSYYQKRNGTPPASDDASAVTADASAAPAAPATDEAAGTSSGQPGDTDVVPLFLAKVDANDTSAVLALLAVIPAAADGSEPLECYKREAGQWVPDPSDLAALEGSNPPPVVELTTEMEQDVLSQIDSGTVSDDSSDADSGADTDASADTSAPTDDSASAVTASLLSVHSYDEETGELSSVDTTGAVLLASYSSVGRLPIDLAAALEETYLNEFVAGKEVTPKDASNAERLRQYWEHGEGAAKIRWGEPNDWYRCRDHLSKYLGTRAAGYCTLRHKAVLGVWPGQEDGGRHGHKHG